MDNTVETKKVESKKEKLIATDGMSVDAVNALIKQELADAEKRFQRKHRQAITARSRRTVRNALFESCATKLSREQKEAVIYAFLNEKQDEFSRWFAERQQAKNKMFEKSV